MMLTEDKLAALIQVYKGQCSRLVHGHCSRRACLNRGGWKPGMSADLATCEELETVEALDVLRRLLQDIAATWPTVAGPPPRVRRVERTPFVFED